MPRPNKGASLKWIAKRQIFYIVWYEKGIERTRSTRTGSREHAEIALADFITARPNTEGGGHPQSAERYHVSSALALYAETRGPKVADPARMGAAIQALTPFWAKRTFGEITPSLIDRYAASRGVSDGTLRRELTVLRAAQNCAVRERHLRFAVPIDLPPPPPGRDRWLTKIEAAALLRAARNSRGDVRLYLPLFILIALYTGARKEAVLSLRWPQIDFKRGRIDFARPDGRRTAKGRALLPIPARLMTFLRIAWRRRPSDIGHVVHRDGQPIKDIGGEWGGVGQKPNGSFGAACERAGIAGVSPHVLRHTCGTWLAQEGVDLWQISGWLGQTIATTTERYAHHHPDYMEDARNAADRRARK